MSKQAVSFKCAICHQPIHTTFFVRIAAPTITIVHRFCSLACLRSWVGHPS